MDVMLQEHGAKHVFHVPEGLRELCADISREVLRAQPEEIYCFIADYVDALLVTRENAKVAVKVVNNILLGSGSIVSILHRTGLNLDQIAAAAGGIQKAFRSYLDIIDIQPDRMSTDTKLEEASRVSIRDILENTGASWSQADQAATMIQAAFRGHYERMLMREEKGEIQWQRAVVNTLQILRKAGVSQEEAAKAATLIQSAYRGYYSRRNIKMNTLETERKKKLGDGLEPRETFQAVAWLDMMYEDSGLSTEKAHQAATVIQSAFREYRVRKGEQITRQSSTKSMVVEAILENLRQRIFAKVLDRENIPEEFGTRDELITAAGEIQETYRQHLKSPQFSRDTENELQTARDFDDVEDSAGENEEREQYDEAIARDVSVYSIGPAVPESTLSDNFHNVEKHETLHNEHSGHAEHNEDSEVPPEKCS